METITVDKKAVEMLIVDFEKLIKDFEEIMDSVVPEEAVRRLKEIESGTEKGVSETEFLEHARKRGINV